MEYKTLNEIATNFRYGKMPDKSKLTDNGDYPVWSGYRYVGYYDEKNVNKDEIVVVARGVGGTGDVKICKEDCFLTNLSIVFNVNEDINPLYVYYYYQIKNLRYLDSGSAQSQITINDLKNVKIPVPRKIIQDKIAEVLNKLDQKIELNNKINNNLYELLEKLYNEKYLNCEMYDTWELLTMNDITNKFATGLNPRKNFVLGHGNNYYVTIKNMPNNQVILDDKCDKVDDEAIVKINKRSDLKVGDLLFSGIGTIGRTYLIKKHPANWNISESVFTIRPNEKISSEFLYLLLLSSDMQNYAISKASGSVQKGIRMADLKLYKLRVPDKKWMNEFTSVISPIIDKIYENFDENIKLSKLRDTLLPRLINGEIDLDNIEI